MANNQPIFSLKSMGLVKIFNKKVQHLELKGIIIYLPTHKHTNQIPNRTQTKELTNYFTNITPTIVKTTSLVVIFPKYLWSGV